MRDYRLSEKARTDIEGILDYTYARFGARQAELYYNSLRACFRMLADNPAIGKSCTTLNPPLRSHHHQRHIIFCDVFDDHVLIVRVLHERMDIERHMGEEA